MAERRRSSPSHASPPKASPPKASPPKASPPKASPPKASPVDVDPARRVAYDLLRQVNQRGAYANLALPTLLREARLTGRDAAFATELAYGTVRAQGTLDAVIAACSTRPPADLDPPVLDLLRLGAYQLLRTRVPAHAAVSESVELARATGSARASGFINAVLRKLGRSSWVQWTTKLGVGQPPVAQLALRYAHPRWIVEAFADSLGSMVELAAALEADDTRPQTHLVARPGRITRAELLVAVDGTALPGPYSPYAVRMDGGDPGAIEAVRDGRAAVQDEGSQLCAIALTAAPVSGRDERWLDLCAGPGGKAALLAALAGERGARLDANELHEHRAELVRQATAFWRVPVSVGAAAELAGIDGGYDRVLLDAPCTGLGALRRRPEARWRRGPQDVPGLQALQIGLLDEAIRLTRPGGLIGYVTCSPHLEETSSVIEQAVATQAVELIDARPYFPGVDALGDGPAVQLWPHRQGTDAMFCALLRRLCQTQAP